MNRNIRDKGWAGSQSKSTLAVSTTTSSVETDVKVNGEDAYATVLKQSFLNSDTTENYPHIDASTAGEITISAEGDADNIDLILAGKGTGSILTSDKLDFTGATSKVISAGSYSSKLALGSGTTELVTIAGETTTADFSIGVGAYMRTTVEDGKAFGFSSLVESTSTAGTPTLQGAQFMAFLGTPGGTQAAHLKTRDGDGTAGLFAIWAKTGANSNCVCDSGSRTAPLWVDNQMSGTMSGEEYGIFASTGASRPDAFVGFETTSSGYDQLFYFDETFNSGAGNCVTTDAVPGGNQDARIKVYYNGTQYYIPLYR